MKAAPPTAAQIEPQEDRVLMKRIERDDRTPGGLFIPQTAQQDPPQEGFVVAVGRGKRDDAGELVPMHVQVGDRVLIGKYTGSEIRVENEDYLIFRQEDVLAIIRPPASR